MIYIYVGAHKTQRRGEFTHFGHVHIIIYIYICIHINMYIFHTYVYIYIYIYVCRSTKNKDTRPLHRF